MKPGDRVRDYILGRKLGEGGMGEVWLARHAMLDMPRALKVMSDALAAEEKFRDRFLREARAMARLEHPNIVGAVEFFEERDRFFLVMPFVEGGSLADRLEKGRGPIPMDEVAAVSRDILDALGYSHGRDIVHRDVKPSNILLDRKGRAHLTDFGIALMAGDVRRTRTGTLVGTLCYMSPEQIERPKQVDHRTDVYSFGCVLYEMLTGEVPFAADSDYELMRKTIEQPPPPPTAYNPDLPEYVQDVLFKALAKDPGHRFQTCGEFYEALQRKGGVCNHPYGVRTVREPVMPPAAPPRPIRTRKDQEPEKSRVVVHPLPQVTPAAAGSEAIVSRGLGFPLWTWIGVAAALVLAVVVMSLLVSGRSKGSGLSEVPPGGAETGVANGPETGKDPDVAVAGWYVQIGSFGSPDHVEKNSALLRGMNYTPVLQRYGGLTRVRTGPYNTREEADAVAQKLCATWPGARPFPPGL